MCIRDSGDCICSDAGAFYVYDQQDAVSYTHLDVYKRQGKGSWAAGGAALLLGFAGSLFLYETASANPGKETAAYRKALEAEEQKEYEKAIRMYQRCGDYAEAAGRLGQCRYRYGEALAGKKKYNAAIEMIRRSGSVSYTHLAATCFYGLVMQPGQTIFQTIEVQPNTTYTIGLNSRSVDGSMVKYGAIGLQGGDEIAEVANKLSLIHICGAVYESGHRRSAV